MYESDKYVVPVISYYICPFFISFYSSSCFTPILETIHKTDFDMMRCQTQLNNIFTNWPSDGLDHSKCCKGKGVTPFCTPFCKGIAPASVITNADKLMECTQESESIFGCIQSGKSELKRNVNSLLLFSKSYWQVHNHSLNVHLQVS